jgi:tRNA(His) 5'-end guanylyltransferase
MGKVKKDALGDRMKSNYENRSKTHLTRRVPCIIRLDGKAFHTFTRGLKRPWDQVLHNSMVATTKYLCEHIQGCKISYTQSDEITLLLTDYETITTDAWFGYSVQKMCSIAASMATYAFNKAFEKEANAVIDAICALQDTDTEKDYLRALNKCLTTGALFDARCFSVPKEEVVNCFIWRQQDATRNAIQMLGQTYFSHKQLDHKTTGQIQDMLWKEKGINFNDMPVPFKRGTCVKREVIMKGEVERHAWVADYNIPIFTKDRNYIEQLLGGETK